MVPIMARRKALLMAPMKALMRAVKMAPTTIPEAGFM
jgi:hypothetical protein